MCKYLESKTKVQGTSEEGIILKRKCRDWSTQEPASEVCLPCMDEKDKMEGNNSSGLIVAAGWTEHPPGPIASPLKSGIEFLRWLA